MAERHNFVKNGVLSLPPGFRFHPSDEELVMQYLRRRVLSLPLPSSIIPDVDVCKSDPWDLPGDAEQERYFFSTREAKYPSGNRANRATVSGYWKATGVDRQIVDSRRNAVAGLKKTLVFYRGKPPTGIKTDWIMHEYRLASPQAPPPAPPRDERLKMNLNQIPVAAAPVGNWVLCRIFLKKRSSKADDGDKTDDAICKVFEIQRSDNVNNDPVFYEFLSTDKKSPADLNLVPSSSSSGSSGVTRVSADRNNTTSEDNEESSSSNSFGFTDLADE